MSRDSENRWTTSSVLDKMVPKGSSEHWFLPRHPDRYGLQKLREARRELRATLPVWRSFSLAKKTKEPMNWQWRTRSLLRRASVWLVKWMIPQLLDARSLDLVAISDTVSHQSLMVAYQSLTFLSVAFHFRKWTLDWSISARSQKTITFLPPQRKKKRK